MSTRATLRARVRDELNDNGATKLWADALPRAALRTRLADPALAALFEPFDVDRYNKNMSVAENLMFGAPVGKGAYQQPRTLRVSVGVRF